MNKHLEELRLILKKKYSALAISTNFSNHRYDDLIHKIDRQHDYINDYFIIKKNARKDVIVIDAVCLYIPSITLLIEKDRGMNGNMLTEAIASDVKIYLYSIVLSQQSRLFQRISENTWHLASGLSHKLITQHVVDGALKTIPFSDAVIFRIYDEKSQLLHPLAVSGFNDNYYDYSVSLHESVSGKVFESKKSVILNSREEILSSFIHYSSARESVMKNNPIANSLICVPVLDKQHCYGTLTILSLDRQSVFNSLAVSLLETFASQVALAWRNAKLYDEKVASFNEVNALKHQLELQNQLLKSSIDFHNEMINLSIKNSNINKFISAISDKVNTQIGYVDISGTKCGSEDVIKTMWDQLTSSLPDKNGSDTAYFYGEHYIQPMVQKHQCIGLIFIKSSEATDYMQVILSRLSDFLIMDIMKKVSRNLIENKRKSALIDKALSSGVDKDIIETMSGYGFIVQDLIACIMLKGKSSSSSNADLLNLDLNTRLNTMLARRNAFVYSDEDIFTIIISDNSAEKIHSLTARIDKELIIPNACQAGVSSISTAINFKQVCGQAKTALAIIKKKNNKGLLHFKHAGLERLFIHHKSEEMEHFISDVLSPLMDDNEKSHTLIKTLHAYINHSCSVNNTAKALEIHPNTLYQRLKKIETLTKMELSNPNDFLIISVACHMLSLSSV